ncbi:SDR family NAD(P)-dependent oxidoreductase [Streptomyces sp. NPDC006356]
MTSIAIVGAGPQLGLAIARTFGSHGFDVALVSRNRDKLDQLVGTLTAEGVSAAAFPADVLDRGALTQALKDAATRFGGIDVLEYSPVGTIGSTTLTTPTATQPSDVQHEMEFQHKELDGTGIQAAHVGIDVSIGMSVVPGFPTAQPEEISPVYWDLHTTRRDQAELVFSR